MIPTWEQEFSFKGVVATPSKFAKAIVPIFIAPFASACFLRLHLPQENVWPFRCDLSLFPQEEHVTDVLNSSTKTIGIPAMAPLYLNCSLILPYAIFIALFRRSF